MLAKDQPFILIGVCATVLIGILVLCCRSSAGLKALSKPRDMPPEIARDAVHGGEVCFLPEFDARHWMAGDGLQRTYPPELARGEVDYSTFMEVLARFNAGVAEVKGRGPVAFRKKIYALVEEFNVSTLGQRRAWLQVR